MQNSSQLKQHPRHVLDHLFFDIALAATLLCRDEIKDKRILEGLLRQFAFRFWQCAAKVTHRTGQRLTFVETRLDLMDQHRPRPTIFYSSLNIPFAFEA